MELEQRKLIERQIPTIGNPEELRIVLDRAAAKNAAVPGNWKLSADIDQNPVIVRLIGLFLLTTTFNREEGRILVV